MTRAKVITISFIIGLMVGCAVPASHAKSIEFGKTFSSVGIDEVDADQCLITLDGTEYEFDDCSDADHFTEGDIAELADKDGNLSVVNSSGYEASITE